MKDTRIQKAIADAGYTSRRKAEELIAAGKVKVNGRPAEIGMKVDVKHDLITVNGEEINTASGEKLWYVALNKPRGFVTTTSDCFSSSIHSLLLKSPSPTRGVNLIVSS